MNVPPTVLLERSMSAPVSAAPATPLVAMEAPTRLGAHTVAVAPAQTPTVVEPVKSAPAMMSTSIQSPLDPKDVTPTPWDGSKS